MAIDQINPNIRSILLDVRSVVKNFSDFHHIWINNPTKVKLTKQISFAQMDLIIHLSMAGSTGNGWYLSFDKLSRSHNNLAQCCKELNLPARVSIESFVFDELVNRVAKTNAIEYMINDGQIFLRCGHTKILCLTSTLNIMKFNLEDVIW